ncbi:MAG: exosortase-associated EpsI family protein [Verrucomicrobiota bacterium]|nr:exosortase-associated EpsI family protein [Verrucomicrobiota bacterium]
MSHSIAVAPAREEKVRAAGMVWRWRLAFTAIAFLFLWLEIILQLQSEWSLNPQYGYGWTVPLLAAWLFYQRWLERPAPAPTGQPGLTITLALLAAAVLLPARLVAVANPDWRFLSWTMAVAAVVITLGAIHLAGGWPWTRHFAFPVLFFLVAVPWPVQLEQLVVQSLMRADTAITIQILNFIGTVAVQHGNVIELSTGQVGIDDACTGVRSLQATFMVALFLGEFYRMRFGRRVLLVVAGLVIAFVCNIGRTLILCEVAATSGVDAIHRWHDPAGFTILGICLFALWGLSLWLKPGFVLENKPAVPAAQRAGRVWLPVALILWLGLAEFATALWYSGPSQNVSSAPWSVTWPESEPDFRREPIPEMVETLLRYNEGGAATWRSADDRRWMMYSFRWLPGRTAALFVKNHRPDICLPASGLTMEQQSGVHLVAVNGAKLPIRSYRFDDNGRPLHIYYCYWDGRSSYVDDAAAASEDWTARGRLQAAWQGKRELGARMLELAVWGHEDDAEARAALERELAKIVR